MIKDEIEQPSSSSWAWSLGALALTLWLIVFQATRLYTSPLLYDDAYLAAAAKSMALGHGYATHYPVQQPFDVRLGVGLALQIPAAALIALFGNRYWVPGLATVLAIDIVLVAIAIHVRRRYGPASQHRVILAGLLAMAILTTDRYEWILSHWYTLLGDIPASLLVILGILFLSRELETRGSPSIWTGLVLGLAVEIKLVTALGTIPAVVLVAATSRAGPNPVRRALPFGAGILLPFVLAQLWQIYSLGGPVHYVEHLAAWKSYFLSEHSGAGVPAQMRLGEWLASRFLVNVRAVIDYFGGNAAATAILILVGVLALRLGWPKRADGDRSREARFASALLLAGVLVHGSWWTLLSTTAWINHLLPALVYLAGAFALTVPLPTTKRLFVATWVAAIVVVVPRLGFLPAYLPAFSKAAGVDSALEVRDVVLTQKAMGLRHIACGWWVPRDLEYLLPDVGNFQDCQLIDRSQFATGQVVLVRNLAFWNWERNDRFQRFAETCEKTPLFRNPRYVLSRCTASP